MKKTPQPEPIDIIYRFKTLQTTFDKSRSTLNRDIANEEFPPPDLPAFKNGSGHGWFKSTIDTYLILLKSGLSPSEATTEILQKHNVGGTA